MGKILVRATTVLLGVVWLAAAIGPRPARAAVMTLYVAPGRPEYGDCDTWGRACDLQYALGKAITGTDIWVLKGLYVPGSPSVQNAAFTVRPGVSLYGGFAGTEGFLGERNWAKNRTVLSGDIDRNDLNTDGNRVAEKWTHIRGQNSYQVVKVDGVSGAKVLTDTVIDGFTITAGDGSGVDTGGLRCLGSGGGHECSPTLRNLIFSGNRGGAGAGLTNDGSQGGVSSPILSNVVFRGNYGGLYIDARSTGNSNPQLYDVTFTGNRANRGGALYIMVAYSGRSAPYFEGVTFSSNTAEQNGGAYFDETYPLGIVSPTFINVTFRGNTAGQGGAINSAASEGAQSTATLTNVTFSGNHSNRGGAMYIGGPGVVYTLTNTILWGDSAPIGPEIDNQSGTARIGYSIVQGGCASISGAICEAGNLNLNPLLNPLANYGGLTNTMTLKPGSPAINAGSNGSCPATDQRGLSRPQAVTCDIGATEFENPTMTFKSIAGNDGWVLEAGAGSNIGGAKNAGATKIRVGDDALNQEYRAVLSFNTAGLPPTATITDVVLRVKEAGIVGDNPLAIANLPVACKNGYFGTLPALQSDDYQAASTHDLGITLFSFAAGGWHASHMNPVNYDCINRTGLTQFRLGFTSESADGQADYINFWSGNALASQRPQLSITYYIP